MDGLCGILFLVIVRTVSARIILQPIYPFETDVTKYKLVEEFYPESDRDALPIVQFLKKLRTANAPDQDLTPPDGNPTPFFTTRRDFTSPKAIRRDLPSPPERTDAPLVARRDPFPYPHLKIFVCVQKPSFLARPWPGRKPTEGQDDTSEITDILTTSLLKAVQKMARAMEKKLSAMTFVVSNFPEIETKSENVK